MSRRLVIGAVLTALSLSGAAPGFAANRPDRGPTEVGSGLVRTLLDTVPRVVGHATELGPLDALTKLQVALPLALPDQAALGRVTATVLTLEALFD